MGLVCADRHKHTECLYPNAPMCVSVFVCVCVCVCVRACVRMCVCVCVWETVAQIFVLCTKRALRESHKRTKPVKNTQVEVVVVNLQVFTESPSPFLSYIKSSR